MILRHGDLLFCPTTKTGKLKKVFKGSKYILAEGEMTGHKHLLIAEPKTEFEIFTDEQGNTILAMAGIGKISHEEHKEITLPIGDYKVIHEREYDYYLEAIKQVQD